MIKIGRSEGGEAPSRSIRQWTIFVAGKLMLLFGSYSAATRQFFAVRRHPDHAFQPLPPPGFMRGIDFYGPLQFFTVLRRAIYRYRIVHDYYPDLVAPRHFAEKLFASKFLRPMKVPESGNKLQTSTFIPPELKSRLQCAAVVWSAPSAILPSNDAVADGLYYLKANHGSGMYRRVHFPLDQKRRDELQTLCALWLTTPYGLRSGEWWYNAFEKQIMLEKALSAEEETISFNVWTFGETIAFITVYCKRRMPDGNWKDSSMWLDPEFRPLPQQHPTRPLLTGWSLPEATKPLITEFASAIGSQFSFARVDFLIDAEGYPHLGEITFSPGNAESRDSERTAQNFGRWKSAEKIRRKYG